MGVAAAVVWTGAALGGDGKELHAFLAWTVMALIALRTVTVVFRSTRSFPPNVHPQGGQI